MSELEVSSAELEVPLAEPEVPLAEPEVPLAEPQVPSAESDIDSDSDTTSSTSLDAIAEDLQQLWNEAMEQCEQVERLHSMILRDTDHLQQSLSENECDDDHIMVTYNGIYQDFMNVLQSIHTKLIEDPTLSVGTTLLSTLELCEFKPLSH